MSDKTQAELMRLVGEYFKDAKWKEDGYYDAIEVSQYGFKEKKYTNTMDIALHILLSSLSVKDFRKNSIMRTLIINEELIFQMFGFKSNLSDKRRRISDSLSNLESNQIIRIVYIDEREEKGRYARFKVVHNVSKDAEGKHVKTFFNIPNNSFERVMMFDNDNEKINSLALMAGIMTRINRVSADTFKKPTSWSRALGLAQGISYESYTKMGEATFMSKNSVAKYVDILEKSKIISVIKVKRANSVKGAWSNYYSKYNERAVLKDYIETVIQSGLPEDKKWMEIIDVKDIHND